MNQRSALRSTLISFAFLVLLLGSSWTPLVSGSVVPSNAQGAGPAAGEGPSATGAPATASPVPATGPWVAVPYPERSLSPTGEPIGVAPAGTEVSVLITLGFSDPSGLDQLLGGLSNVRSPLYHAYLTQSEFDQRFAAPSAEYSSLVQYVESKGASDVQTYADRTSLSFDATPAQVHAIFHATLEQYRLGTDSFVAPTGSPELPSSLAADVVQVSGLSTSPLLEASLGPGGSVLHATDTAGAGGVHDSAGFLPPATYGGVQYEFGPDFQGVYDELSLFQQEGFPTDQVVATILWSGQYLYSPITTPYGSLSTDQYLGPYVESDISDFFNETIPSSEPQSTFHAVPLNGAPGVSRLDSWDSVGADFENTLDLEMVGSTAPGAQIYNVYGESNSFTQLDTDFAYILNPTNTPGLDNVSVISDSWYGTDHNDSGWYQDLEEAQARGISVLACSGDSGDNDASSKYFGAVAAYPGTMAYNDFGTTSVGGTTVDLSPDGLSLLNQTVWNISTNDVSDGGPAGSEGGISSIIAEPSWQLDTEANTVIHGAGRAVPDLSAVANNTLITLTVNGTQYRASNASTGHLFYYAWGTSIATPMTAGMLAEIDHVLERNHQGWLGFLDPNLYNLANQLVETPLFNATRGWFTDQGYNSTLPVNVTMQVLWGRNDVDLALPGYNLVDGWGDLDAYNFTVMVLRTNSSGVWGRLWGVDDNMTLSGIAGTSATGYLASVQQNFFLADSLGAPIYWVQNVIYIIKSGSTLELNYTGWLIYPFYGQYPYQAGYEYYWPLEGHDLKTPLDWNVSTVLSPGVGLDGQSVQFNVGYYSVTLPVPGAAYMIGSLWYNYSWEGVTYENGPFSPNPTPGGLGVQFGLVGGPSGGNTSYRSPTAGTVSAYVMPYGSTAWAPAETSIVWPSITETGETSYNLAYTRTSQNTWTMGISATSMDQGIVSYQAPEHDYPVDITETGLPSGSLWWANFTTGQSFSSDTSTITLAEPNGSYTYTVAAGPIGYVASPPGGGFTVAGASVSQSVVFSQETIVDVTENGLPSGTSWGVTVGTSTKTGSTTSLDLVEPAGSYAYSVQAVPGYVRSPFAGTLPVSGVEVWLNVTYSVPLYPVTFTDVSSPGPSVWWVNFTAGGTWEAPGSTVSWDEPNGTYDYTIAANGWQAGHPSGSVTVSEGPATVEVTFTQVAYLVTFTPSGSGPASYYVNVTGQASRSATWGTSIAFSEPNGSFPFTLESSSPIWKPAFALSTLKVDGQPLTIPISAAKVTSAITFSESGLPSSSLSSWSVSLFPSATATASGSTIGFTLTNGSYTYTVTAPSGYSASRTSGSLVATGVAQTINIEFNATSSGSSSGPGGFLGLGSLGLLLVLGVVIVAVLLVAVVAMRRKKGQPPSPSGSGASAWTAPSPPPGAPMEPPPEGAYPPTYPPQG